MSESRGCGESKEQDGVELADMDLALESWGSTLLADLTETQE
jgi:hypothetical protein